MINVPIIQDYRCSKIENLRPIQLLSFPHLTAALRSPISHIITGLKEERRRQVHSAIIPISSSRENHIMRYKPPKLPGNENRLAQWHFKGGNKPRPTETKSKGDNTEKPRFCKGIAQPDYFECPTFYGNQLLWAYWPICGRRFDEH